MNEGKKHLTDTVTSTTQTKIRPDTKNECWEKQPVSVHSNILHQMLPQDPDRNNFKNTAVKLNEGFTSFSYLGNQKNLHYFYTRDCL